MAGLLYLGRAGTKGRGKKFDPGIKPYLPRRPARKVPAPGRMDTNRPRQTPILWTRSNQRKRSCPSSDCTAGVFSGNSS